MMSLLARRALIVGNLSGVASAAPAVTPIVLAHGQTLVPVIFIGFPAALLATVCFLVAAFLGAKKRKEDEKIRETLKIAGTFLAVLAIFSPAFERFVE